MSFTRQPSDNIFDPEFVAARKAEKNERLKENAEDKAKRARMRQHIPAADVEEAGTRDCDVPGCGSVKTMPCTFTNKMGHRFDLSTLGFRYHHSRYQGSKNFDVLTPQVLKALTQRYLKSESENVRSVRYRWIGRP